jgi:hypothetical protein
MIKFFNIIIYTILLSGCTVATYELQSQLENPVALNNKCNIVFGVTLESSRQTNSLGIKQDAKEKIETLSEDYIKSTSAALTELGCKYSFSSLETDIDLIIKIERKLQLSALPQEYLTGLSLGLIPSSGTKYGQFVYSFQFTETDKKFIYKVNQTNYNHLFIAPIFWVSFITANEQKTYQEAIINFIKNT